MAYDSGRLKRKSFFDENGAILSVTFDKLFDEGFVIKYGFFYGKDIPIFIWDLLYQYLGLSKEVNNSYLAQLA